MEDKFTGIDPDDEGAAPDGVAAAAGAGAGAAFVWVDKPDTNEQGKVEDKRLMIICKGSQWLEAMTKMHNNSEHNTNCLLQVTKLPTTLEFFEMQYKYQGL